MIPEIDIEGFKCVSGHFYGVYIASDTYVVQFAVREGFDGSDLLILKQEVHDEGNYTLDKAVEIARRILAANLEQLAKDIRTGKVEPDSEEDIERLERLEESIKNE